MGKLEGKVAVITGGNSGIGLAVARQLREEGAQTVIFGRDAETLASAAGSIGGDCLTVQGNLRRLDDLDKLFAETKARFGHIDILVANGGDAVFKPIGDQDEADFDKISDTNFKGTFFTIQKALPLMKDGGTIVIVASVVASKGLPGMTVYAATKAALRSLARTLTVELAPRGIRINVLSPGVIDTPAFGRIPGLTEEAKEGFKNIVPLGRVGKSEEMAKVALFLASADSSYVAGAEISADAGWGQV
jgi:NAD(P)-dependent dehydrogenase (short-subunit alcohol dehydrogenase family)